MTFWIDENLSRTLATILALVFTRHHFSSTVDLVGAGQKDVAIFSAASRASPKPVFISADQRILRNPSETKALKDVGISVIFLGEVYRHMLWPEKVWKIIKALDEWMPKIGDSRRATVFELMPNASIKRMFYL